MTPKKDKKKITSWVLQVLLAGLFLMAALPKLTGDPMAMAMVAKLGLGNWAAYAIGLSELAAALLLLVPRTIALGALLGLGILLGAILSHLTVLGISLGEEDGGTMFLMGIGGAIMAGIVATLRRQQVLHLTGKEAVSTR